VDADEGQKMNSFSILTLSQERWTKWRDAQTKRNAYRVICGKCFEAFAGDYGEATTPKLRFPPY
jgi:hypothetical protein